MTEHPCGCVNGVDEASGLLHCLFKCAHHVDWLKNMPRGRPYYESLGCFADGIPQCTAYVRQLEEALGYLPGGSGLALEVGGGASMYAGHLQRLGYEYLGVEPDHWGATWTRETYGARVTEGPFPERPRGLDGWGDQRCALLLCAHALEHLPDAPGALREMRRLLARPGPLFIVVPDDTDRTNPDHLWFFTEDTLRAALLHAGFNNVKIAVRKYTDRESFIYARAD